VDLILAHVNDLGGLEMVSEAQLPICRRASAMECELEAMEARMSAGETVDPDQYGRLAGRLCSGRSPRSWEPAKVRLIEI